MTSLHTSEQPGYFVGRGDNILEANKSLPSSQFDPRNLNSTRYIEVGFDFPDAITPITAEKPSRVVDISGLANEMFYDKSVMFRYSTFGIDSFIITRETAFAEEDRQPLAVNIPELSRITESRYSFLMSVDSNILPSSSSVTVVGPLPGSLTFEFGAININPLDGKIYAPNTTRTSPFNMASQQLKTVLIRFYVKTMFEPNFISFIGVQNASLAASLSASASAIPPTGGELGGGGGSSVQQASVASIADDVSMYQGSLADTSTMLQHQGILANVTAPASISSHLSPESVLAPSTLLQPPSLLPSEQQRSRSLFVRNDRNSMVRSFSRPGGFAPLAPPVPNSVFSAIKAVASNPAVSAAGIEAPAPKRGPGRPPGSQNRKRRNKEGGDAVVGSASVVGEGAGALVGSGDIVEA